MRQNQNHKRSRGRGRRGNHIGQQNFNRNTTFESNGPEGRLRGNAQQLFEKYTALAQDAQASGERISFEAFSQFADHYYRIHQSILANAEQRRQHDRQQDQTDKEAREGELDQEKQAEAAPQKKKSQNKTEAQAPDAKEDAPQEEAAKAEPDTGEGEDNSAVA